jgi:DNA-binding MarR family transcriptional regulator
LARKLKADTSPMQMGDTFHGLPLAKLGLINRLLRREAELAYRDKVGVTLNECWPLSLAAANPSGISFKEFCGGSGLDKGQASRTLSQLVSRGLIKRQDHPDDQRSFVLTITPEGMKVYRRGMELAMARSRHVLAVLSARQQKDLIKYFDILLQALQEQAANK